MRIKDAYGVYHDIALPPDLERQLYQTNQVTYGYIDLSKRGKEHGNNSEQLFSRHEKKY